MPEGDTIHNIAKHFRDLFLGSKVKDSHVFSSKSTLRAKKHLLKGAHLTNVDAKGKHLLLQFEGGLVLHSHLMMSGSWHFYPHGCKWSRNSKAAWLVMDFEAQSAVQFNGPTLELAASKVEARRLFAKLAQLGPDILSPTFNFQLFLQRARASSASVGEVLLNQLVVAGIGNVWKSEGCWQVQIDPWRSISEVSDDELNKLIDFLKNGMAYCVEHGTQNRPKNVYRQRGKPCKRCGCLIKANAQGLAARMTYWCPNCQR